LNVTTNAAGNAYVHFNPCASASTVFGYLYNGADLSLATGVQTAGPTLFSGPYSAASANIAQMRVAAMVISIKKLPSVLNQQGAVHLCTYDTALTAARASGTVAGFAVLGLNDATRSPYFSTLALSDACGQSIVYNPYANENLEQWV